MIARTTTALAVLLLTLAVMQQGAVAFRPLFNPHHHGFPGMGMASLFADPFPSLVRPRAAPSFFADHQPSFLRLERLLAELLQEEARLTAHLSKMQGIEGAAEAPKALPAAEEADALLLEQQQQQQQEEEAAAARLRERQLLMEKQMQEERLRREQQQRLREEQLKQQRAAYEKRVQEEQARRERARQQYAEQQRAERLRLQKQWEERQQFLREQQEAREHKAREELLQQQKQQAARERLAREQQARAREQQIRDLKEQKARLLREQQIRDEMERQLDEKVEVVSRGPFRKQVVQKRQPAAEAPSAPSGYELDEDGNLWQAGGIWVGEKEEQRVPEYVHAQSEHEEAMDMIRRFLERSD